MNREDEALYNAQAQAFEGTPLGDYFDRRSLMAEVQEITNRLNHLTGDIEVSEARATLVKHAAYAQGQRIKFAPTDMSRFIAIHEVSHVVHVRSKLGGRSHGPEYRAIFAEMVEIVYGPNFARLLREAFSQLSLDVHPATLPKLAEPIIDLEALADATRESRWL